jgi:hypothetical protein
MAGVGRDDGRHRGRDRIDHQASPTQPHPGNLRHPQAAAVGKFRSMLVDPEMLRAVAGQTEVTSSMIAEADVGTKVSTAADGLSGSTTQWAARLVGRHVAEQANAIATNVTMMGQAVKGAGNTYEVTDSELAGSFKGIF